jgi:uncharacterized protein (TIGR03435 family)
MTDDMDLLREYARSQSEAAFEALVSRHLNLVYSSALRQVSDAHLAQDIAQAVFIILAQKAKSLGARTMLAGWLYQATRYACADALKGLRRRQHREQEAFMQSLANPSASEVWLQIAPLLDEAMAQLKDKDRNLVVMRYFENKSAREMADALGLEPPAAQKRLTRAVEKLRVYFAKRGLPHSAAVMAESISANSVCLAPAGLAKTIALAAAAKGAAAGGSTLALVQGALKTMAWSKALEAMAIGAGLLVAVGAVTLAVDELEDWFDPPGGADLVPPPVKPSVAQAVNPAGYPWQLLAFPTNAIGGKDINGLVMETAPPMVEILPSLGTNTNGNNSTSSASTIAEVKRLGTGFTIQQMVMSAYDYAWTDCRTIVATPLPLDRYDYIDNLPKGATQAFKDALKKKFGVTGRVVAMETNVLLLQIMRTNAPGLKPSQPNSGNTDTESSGPYAKEKHSRSSSFRNWVDWCERTLQIPVVDGTGLRGNYDTDLKWEWREGQSEKDAFKQAVLDQLGLKLVPARKAIDILVIERAKD